MSEYTLPEMAPRCEVSPWAREEFDRLRSRKQTVMSFRAAGLMLLNARPALVTDSPPGLDQTMSESIASWFRAAPLAAHKDAAEEALLLLNRIDDCIDMSEHATASTLEAVVSEAVAMRYQLECLLLPWIYASRTPPSPLSPDVETMWQYTIAQTCALDERAAVFEGYFPVELALPAEAFMFVDPLCWWSPASMNSENVRMFDDILGESPK